MDDLQSVFEVLEPPLGGLNGLRGKLELRRGWRGFVLVGVAVAALALVATVNTSRAPSESLDLGNDVLAVTLGLVARSTEPVVSTRPDRFAVSRVSVTDDVVFYRGMGLVVSAEHL